MWVYLQYEIFCYGKAAEAARTVDKYSILVINGLDDHKYSKGYKYE